MPEIDLLNVGSLQTGPRYDAEDPLEEVWMQVSRLGSEDYIRRHTSASEASVDWDLHTSYAAVRIRQALEFRRSARAASLLTSPLPFYYSFLNLLRAHLAIVAEVMPSPTHGLRFKQGSSLLECQAEIVSGTFMDYLDARQFGGRKGVHLSLKDCLVRIVELAFDVKTSPIGHSLVIPVRVRSYMSGAMLLLFDSGYVDEEHFRAKWDAEFPKLSQVCALAETGARLDLNLNIKTAEYEEATAFCSEHLVAPLRFQETADWYVTREIDHDLVLPRDVYYYVAMFILGSAVRYQPELMLDAARPGSEIGWLLNRFLRVAERYYPHLQQNWATGMTLYFG